MSGFDLWKNDSPLVTFSTLSPPPSVLTETGKGLPAGWVSQWGDKKVQKQTDGSWAHVPHETPTGMQPYYKGSGETLHLTTDQEMMAYLKSVNFSDPVTQKSLTVGSPKFVGDMLKKFGHGWFDKYKALIAAQADAPGGTPPAAAPPPPPASSGSPIEQAMKQLNIAAGSKEAFAVEAFHKSGSLEATVDAYSHKFGIKYATAYDSLEALMKKGSGKGTWSYSGNFDDGYKIAFNVGTGPVISAPAIAATASAPSLGVTVPPPAPLKAKKPKPSDSTPVPPAPPIPSLKGVDAPTEPKVIALAQKLGYGADSDAAKVLSLWRTFAAKNHITAPKAAAAQVALHSKWKDTDAQAFVYGLLDKVYAMPGWDFADFVVDSGASGPDKKKPEPISTPIPSTVAPPAPPTGPAVVAPPGLKPVPEVPPTLALDKAVSDMVAKCNFKMGSAGAVAVAMLTTHDGDLSAASKGLASALGWTDAAAFKIAKFVQAMMSAFKSGTDVPETPALVAKLIGTTSGTGSKPAKEKRAVPDIQQTIPPIASLNFAGDAKSKLGGNKPKKFLKDEQGNLYLHKYGADQIRAAGGEVASNIAAIVAGPGLFVPVQAVEYEGDWGTVQPMVQNVVKDGLPTDPALLSKEDIKQLQRERLLDWVTSSHDTKVGNFIKTKSGQIFGVDKEQAFKFIGADALSLDYKPNPSEPFYNPLYKAYANKEIDLDPNDMVPFIKAVEKASDEDWLNAVKPYLDALPASERDAKAEAILARKNSVRKDFEAFFTTLKKKRGEFGVFKFAGGAPTAPATAVPAGEPPFKKKKHAEFGTLVPPDVPPMSALKYTGAASAIGGAGEKHFYTDSEGKKWLLKVAADKATKKSTPFKVAAQTMFAMVGKAVKPATPPVGAAEFKGKPATIQPWLGDDLKTLSGVDPADLTPSQKKDVADEHVLDWLMSQHDTHGENLVKLPTGEVVGIDKEQGFKYLLPTPKYTANTPTGDKLSTDYHPNSQYGEQEPYYNKFWKAFASGSMSFDPTAMKSAIEAVEKIPDDAYSIALGAYGVTAFPEDAVTAAKFYDKALTRKKKIRAEFEAFITEQFKKRTKKNGVFSFESGWVPEGSSVPVAPGLPAVPTEPAPPKKSLSAPHDSPVPKPAGFVAPSMAAFVGAASKLGFSGVSVYKTALQQLHLYNNNLTDAANQLSWLKNLSPEVALKRVKYAAKKLKAAGGWAAFEPGAAPQPGAPVSAVPTPTAASTYSPVTALNPPSSGTGGTPTTTFVPGNDGELGNTNVKMVTPGEAYKPPPPPPLPPVPAGFDAPPEGKMWEVKKASAFFATGADGHLYKTKAPKNAAGEPDPSSPNLVAKFHGTTQSAVKEAFDQVGVKPVVPIKTKGSNVIALLKKEDWTKAQTSDKKLGVLIDLPPPPPPPSGKFMPVPQAGELKNAPSNAGMKELAKVQDALLGYGANYRLDGPNIEHHSMSVQRRIDSNGKTFYRFAFKLREPVWKKLKGFDTVTGQFRHASYNAKEDAFKESDKTIHSYEARRWSAGAGSRATLCIDNGKSFALKGMVTAEVYPESGQTPAEAFQKLLKSMDPDLAKSVLKDPSPEDEKLLALSALYWSAAPSLADSLSESQRTVDELTKRLKQHGYSQEQMDSIRFERVGIDHTVPVLPGRHKELQKKHGISHISVAVSDPAKVMLQIRGGTVGVVQRLKHGVLPQGTSAGSDLESGGGDYVFTMPGKKAASSWSNGWGNIEMVYDPSELDRLDAFMYTHDGYGRTKGESFHERPSLEKSAGSAAEIVFRQGLSSNKLLKVRCKTESAASSLIKSMKDAGITKVNGMTPEELVVVGDQFYDTFLKPGGY